MFEIYVNNKLVQLLQPINHVISIKIQHIKGVPIPVQSIHSKAIAEWLYEITQAATGSIEYNGTILTADQVNKPVHMK